MKLFIQLAFVYIFSLTVANTYAQEIIKVKKKYIHKHKVYDFHSMDEIFNSDPNSYSAYKSAMKANDAFKVSSFITWGALMSVVILPAFDNSNNDCSYICVPTDRQVRIATIWFSSLAISLSARLISKSIYNKRKAKAINLFNNDQDVGHLMPPLKWELRIGGGQHGMGIVVAL